MVPAVEVVVREYFPVAIQRVRSPSDEFHRAVKHKVHMGKQLENKKSTHLGSSNHEVEILADTSLPIHSPGPGMIDDTSSSSPSSSLAFKLSMTNGPHVATRMGFRPLSATTKFSTPPVNVNKTRRQSHCPCDDQNKRTDLSRPDQRTLQVVGPPVVRTLETLRARCGLAFSRFIGGRRNRTRDVPRRGRHLHRVMPVRVKQNTRAVSLIAHAD